MDEAFRSEMAAGYTFEDEQALVLGSPILGDDVLTDVRVQLPLSRVNRHGLIAGATGTGKTTTLQILAGQLSAAGVPVFAVDVKGDLSGVGAPGDPANKNVVKRSESLAWTFRPAAHPLELMSLSGSVGSHVRASVSSFGPLLLGKVLDLNETQTSIRWSSATATTRTCRCSTSPTCERPSSSWARTRESRSWRTWAGSARRAWA